MSVKEKEYIVKASKEVILAAGAFQTPKLLELSGIGDRRLLEAHSIQVCIDNANFGENLQDHLMTGISFEVMDGIFTGDGLMRQEPEITETAMQMYTTAKAGPLYAGGIGSYAIMPLLNSLGSGDRASLERVLQECKPQDPNDAIMSSCAQYLRAIRRHRLRCSCSLRRSTFTTILPRKTLHRISPPEITSVSVLPCSIHFRAGASISPLRTHPTSPTLTPSTYPMHSMLTFSPIISDF